MPALISTDGFNHFINYQDAVGRGESCPLSNSFGTNDTNGAVISQLLTARFGVDTTKWLRVTGQNSDSSSDWYALKFPSGGDNLTGTITNTTNHRYKFKTVSGSHTLNTSNTSTYVGTTPAAGSISAPTFLFGVLNDFSLTLAGFSSSTLATCVYFLYAGWVKNPAYSTTNNPLNFSVMLGGSGISSSHATSANGTTVTNYLMTGLANPTVDCATATAGADSIQLLFRNSTDNVYVGDAYNLIQVPSSAVIGTAYRLNGVDPDGVAGSSFWMPVFTMGSRKVAMRIKTYDIG